MTRRLALIITFCSFLFGFKNKIFCQAGEICSRCISASVSTAKTFCEPAPLGTYGSLIIYGTDVNLTLDYVGSYEDGGHAQAICDDPSRGVLMDYSEFFGCPVTPLVADHRNQGFDALYSVEPDQTIAEMFYPNGTSQRFICRDKTDDGVNDEVYVWAHDYYAVLLHPSDWLCIYTCNPVGWWSLTVTFWEPIY